jgi:Ca-activated chloride channel homolog
MPNEQIEIELRYTELLSPTAGVYEVVYPTVVGPRYPSKEGAEDTGRRVHAGYLHEGELPTSTLHISARVSAGVPITELNSPSHQILPEWKGTSVAQLTLDEANAFQGNRDFILRYRLRGKAITSGLILFQGHDENFFLYMAQPPQRVAVADIPPREYIFVVDVSGSMEGFPLDTSKRLLENLIEKLRPTDLFNVVLFAGDSTLLSERSLEANSENSSRAIQLLQEQRGSGGTELLPAIRQAMSIPQQNGVSRSVVVVTDGYVSGEDGVFDHIRQNLNRSNIFAFGIGSSVNRYLIEGIAKAGMGEPFVVTEPSEAGKIAENFREYIQTPVLTNIRVKAEGFDVYDVYPAQQPDLMAERPVVVFGKWRGPVGGTFELVGNTPGGEYSTSMDIATFEPDESNLALQYLWARSRISELSEYGVGNLPDEKVRAITDLGLQYSLLTPYTSFIAVREVVTNPDGTAEDVDQPLPLPLGVSDLAVGSEPEFVWLLVSLALIALVIFFRYKRQQGRGINLPSLAG